MPEPTVGRVLAVLLAAAALTLASPLHVLLWSPLLLGVPHVLGDVRLLVTSPVVPVHVRAHLAMAAPLAGLVASRAVGLTDGVDRTSAEVLLGVLAVVAGLSTGPGTFARRALVGLAAGLLALLAWLAPSTLALGFGHAHNLVGLSALVWWTRGSRWSWTLLGGSIGLGAVVLSGAVDAWLTGLAPGSTVSGLGADGLRSSLAPGLSDAVAVRVVATYALLQLMHYAVWVVFAPPIAGPLHLRPWMIALVAAACLALPLAAWSAPASVRASYLALVLFHGWLELAVIGHQLVRGGDRVRGSERVRGRDG